MPATRRGFVQLIAAATLTTGLGVAPGRGEGGTAVARARDATTFDQLLHQACRAAVEKRWAEGEALFTRAAALNGRTFNEAECRLMSQCCRGVAKIREALPYAERAWQLNPWAGNAIELGEAYKDNARYDLARRFLAQALTSRHLGRDRVAIAQLATVYQATLIHYYAMDLVLDVHRYGGDIEAAIRTAGGYDFFVPVDTDYQKAVIYLSGAGSHTETVDTVGNRRWRIVPADIDQPVLMRIVLKIVPGAFDLYRVDSPAYSVPHAVQPYLAKTEGIDPTTHLAQATAAPLAGQTIRQTVYNVCRWWEATLTNPAPVVGDGSEAVLLNRGGACRGQSEAVTAVFRALGIAARPVRGHSGIDPGTQPAGHTWVEVYLPGLGWVPLQNGWPVGHAIPCFVRFVAEPVDRTSHSRILNWDMCNNFYISQFMDFFCCSANNDLKLRFLGRSLEDEPVDKVLSRDLERVPVGKAPQE